APSDGEPKMPNRYRCGLGIIPRDTEAFSEYYRAVFGINPVFWPVSLLDSGIPLIFPQRAFGATPSSFREGRFREPKVNPKGFWVQPKVNRKNVWVNPTEIWVVIGLSRSKSFRF